MLSLCYIYIKCLYVTLTYFISIYCYLWINHSRRRPLYLAAYCDYILGCFRSVFWPQARASLSSDLWHVKRKRSFFILKIFYTPLYGRLAEPAYHSPTALMRVCLCACPCARVGFWPNKSTFAYGCCPNICLHP